MTFALPSAFWLAACAAPIIVFYILKVRLRRQTVSTNLFWKQIFDEKPPRSIWQYLRHLLSLLVQLALLALLVLAIADPYLPWELLAARRMVLVVDRSASMQAKDVDPTRFDAAIDSALKFVDGLRFRDELAIVTAGPEPEVVVGMTSHVPTLKRALRSLHVSDEPANLQRAVELGKQLVGSHPHGEVLVYTDGCDELPLEAKSDSAPPTDPKSEEHTPKISQAIFGTRVNNVGITQLQIRRSLVDPIGYEALISVANAGDEPLDCRLELTLNDVPVDVVPLHLKPNERWQRSLQKTSIDGGTFVATLTQISAGGASAGKDEESAPKANGGVDIAKLDSLAADDTAYAILAPRKPQQVLLVTEGNLFLQKVFEANPLVECKVVKELPKEWPKDAVIVLHREVPASLPPGDV
ncbi:MAG TPA: VWA domain-containing protein, partial [Lacipirellulaceae bacterium]|nr:VWA domain-containing protein [Lacipirellulaceae bacterium]